jgi:phage shock protein A
MGLFDRLSRVVRANLNDLVSKAEDPEKVLEQSLIDMQEDLIQLRQAVASTIATQKRTEQQYQKNLQNAEQWQQRAQLALSKGDENLARQALTQKKTYADTAASLKIQLDQQVTQVETLKRNLIALESKISEAKTKKDMLKARASAAKANQQLQETIGNMGTSSAMAAFERMEEKVMQLEAQSQAAAELGGTGVENQWAQLEGSSVVEDELAMLKLQMAGGSPNQAALPEQKITDSTPKTPANPAIDDELEALRRELNK